MIILRCPINSRSLLTKRYLISNVNLSGHYSTKYIPSFFLFSATTVSTVHLDDDTTQLIWRSKPLTPVFDDFQRIECPAAAKKVSHTAMKQVIVGWCRIRERHSISSRSFIFALMMASAVCPALALSCCRSMDNGPLERRKRCNPTVHCRVLRSFQYFEETWSE